MAGQELGRRIGLGVERRLDRWVQSVADGAIRALFKVSRVKS